MATVGDIRNIHDMIARIDDRLDRLIGRIAEVERVVATTKTDAVTEAAASVDASVSAAIQTLKAELKAELKSSSKNI